MPQVSLSDEVLAEIWKRANPQPFENLTPEIGLRRVFDMPAPNGEQGRNQTSDARENPPPLRPPRQKAPKADLEKLARAGLIRQGETLHLIDYQRKRVPSVQATVSGPLLECGGQHGTMSYLAQKHLSRHGYGSQAVRGPAHWVNSKDESIMQLWQEYLTSASTRE